MSFENLNNRITQIEERLNEIDSLINVRRGQKPVQEQINGIYKILMDYHKRINKIENK